MAAGLRSHERGPLGSGDPRLYLAGGVVCIAARIMKYLLWESLQPRHQPGPSRGAHDILTVQVSSLSRCSSFLVQPKRKVRKLSSSSSSDEYVDPALGDSSTLSSSDDSSSISASPEPSVSPAITIRDDAVLPHIDKGKIPILMRGRVERQAGRLIRRSVYPSLPPEDDPYAAVDRPFIEHLPEGPPRWGAYRDRPHRCLAIRCQPRTSAGPGRRLATGQLGRSQKR